MISSMHLRLIGVALVFFCPAFVTALPMMAPSGSPEAFWNELSDIVGHHDAHSRSRELAQSPSRSPSLSFAMPVSPHQPGPATSAEARGKTRVPVTSPPRTVEAAHTEQGPLQDKNKMWSADELKSKPMWSVDELKSRPPPPPRPGVQEGAQKSAKVFNYHERYQYALDNTKDDISSADLNDATILLWHKARWRVRRETGKEKSLPEHAEEYRQRPRSQRIAASAHGGREQNEASASASRKRKQNEASSKAARELVTSDQLDQPSTNLEHFLRSIDNLKAPEQATVYRLENLENYRKRLRMACEETRKHEGPTVPNDILHKASSHVWHLTNRKNVLVEDPQKLKLLTLRDHAKSYSRSIELQQERRARNRLRGVEAGPGPSQSSKDPLRFKIKLPPRNPSLTVPTSREPANDIAGGFDQNTRRLTQPEQIVEDPQKKRRITSRDSAESDSGRSDSKKRRREEYTGVEAGAGPSQSTNNPLKFRIKLPPRNPSSTVPASREPGNDTAGGFNG